MSYNDHTAAWRRLRNLVLCRRCGGFPGTSCTCNARGLRARLRRLWRSVTRAPLRSEMLALRVRLIEAEQKLDAERDRRRRAESALATEKFRKQALLDSMTPSPRRGRA
jgi:hypothetical protein